MSTGYTQTFGDENHSLVSLSWLRIGQMVDQIARQVGRDGAPQTLVAVLRGGAIPAVWLSHRLQLRDVRAVEVTHTINEGPHAAKVPQPVAVNPESLGNLADRDVLLVDDVAGTGHTMDVAQRLASGAGAGRVRSAVCSVNVDNWTSPLPAGETITYIGATTRGWVIFPWESNHER